MISPIIEYVTKIHPKRDTRYIVVDNKIYVNEESTDPGYSPYGTYQKFLQWKATKQMIIPYLVDRTYHIIAIRRSL